MFATLEHINSRPRPFEFYTASDLWTDEHTSEQMLAYHLNDAIDASSRNAAFIGKSVEWIVNRFNVGTVTKIADFGCGPGLYAIRLARAGAQVTGIDFSGRSIRYAEEAARKESLSIDYINRNYLEFETGERFDLAMMIMCDFCALSPAQRQQMLRKFQTILKPGGRILLDAYTLTAFEGREESATYAENLLNGFWSPEKYYGFLNVFKYNDEKVILDKYTIVETGSTKTVYNWLQYFSPEVLREEFKANGFEVENIYSDVAGTPFNEGTAEFAIVARKI